MADIRNLSERVIEVAERTANVADAASGKDARKGKVKARWLLLPAAGAGLYALTTSGPFTRQAKDVMTQAREKASDLPEELMSRVHEATGSSAANGRRSQSGSRSRAKSRNTRRRSAATR
jgi:hypothetical protein